MKRRARTDSGLINPATVLFLAIVHLMAAGAALAAWDYGDAPEGYLAYPNTGLVGHFPTCFDLMQHFVRQANPAASYFGLDGSCHRAPTLSP